MGKPTVSIGRAAMGGDGKRSAFVFWGAVDVSAPSLPLSLFEEDSSAEFWLISPLAKRVDVYSLSLKHFQISALFQNA